MLSKKSIKVISILILAVMVLFTIASVTCMATEIPNATPYTPDAKVSGTIGSILGIIKYGGIIAAVIVAMYIGIKYIIASPDAKAEIKKTIIYYVVGIVILLSASVIVTTIETTLGA